MSIVHAHLPLVAKMHMHHVSAAGNGYGLQLASPLLYDHLGEVKPLDGGHSVEFRANVAILSRNVVIQGSPLSALDKHGAHIMLHSRSHKSINDRSQGESLTARIENIELRYAGQMGRLGRYPSERTDSEPAHRF